MWINVVSMNVNMNMLDLVVRVVVTARREYRVFPNVDGIWDMGYGREVLKEEMRGDV
jgi:hypothetical protein